MTLPILYSLRNCPYAMRARLAIFKSRLAVELRDVVLKNKPAEMLAASPKGTVPVLVLGSSAIPSKTVPLKMPLKVIDESLDVMLWALGESDPDNLLHNTSTENQEFLGSQSAAILNTKYDKAVSKLPEILQLIYQFDDEFKTCLEQYKCAKRYHESNLIGCRQACEVYISMLEKRLASHSYIIGDKESLADIALLPFIRQFARVERQWYLQSPYPNVKRWLNQYLQSAMFTKVMAKYPLWSEHSETVVFNN